MISTASNFKWLVKLGGGQAKPPFAGFKDVDSFIERCRAVAVLANESNERPVANVIMDMARKLEKVNGQDVRDKIYPIIDRAVAALSTR